MAQWLGLHAFTAKAQGSIVGCGTKIPQAMLHGKKKKGTELETEHPSSKRKQRVTRRWAGGSQGYLSQKENGQEKIILRGNTRHRDGGRDSPAEIRDQGPRQRETQGQKLHTGQK